MIDRTHRLPLTRQAAALGISRRHPAERPSATETGFSYSLNVSSKHR